MKLWDGVFPYIGKMILLSYNVKKTTTEGTVVAIKWVFRGYFYSKTNISTMNLVGISIIYQLVYIFLYRTIYKNWYPNTNKVLYNNNLVEKGINDLLA